MQRAAVILALATGASALRPNQCSTSSLAPRREFLGAAAGAAAAATTLLPQAAHATGKATQKTLFLRYEKRIAGLGSYFDELESAISNADWAAVTTACEADTSKKGKIGPVYSGLTAMELWANTYSDRKQSVKTQRMLAEAEIVNKVREYVGGGAGKGTGECLKAEGGFFGLGAKAPPRPSDRELTSAALGAVKQARGAFNRFVALNNEALPLDINGLVAIAE